MTERITILPQAAGDFAALPHPDGITCAIMLGTQSKREVVIHRLFFVPNSSEQMKPPRAVDDGYHILLSDREAAEDAARKLGLEIVGHAHTHPHENPGVSKSDWLRLKTGELGAVYHPGASVVTFFRFRTRPGEKGGVAGRVRIGLDAAPVTAAWFAATFDGLKPGSKPPEIGATVQAPGDDPSTIKLAREMLAEFRHNPRDFESPDGKDAERFEALAAALKLAKKESRK